MQLEKLATRRVGIHRSEVNEAVSKATNWQTKIRPHTANDLLKKFVLSLQSLTPKSRTMLSESTLDVELDFLSSRQARRIPAYRTLVMDEAPIYSTDTGHYAFGWRSSDGAQVIKPDVPIHMTVVACVRGNGAKLPLLFIEHKKKTKTSKGIGGMNAGIMVTWIREVFMPALKSDDVVLMGNLSSHVAK